MQRLLYVISFTSDLELSKKFYRDGLGLTVGTDTPFWVDFAGDGAGLALLAMSPGQKREVELCFEAENVAASVKALRGRGIVFLDEVRKLAFGSVIHFRDPEGNLFSLLQPSPDIGGGEMPRSEARARREAAAAQAARAQTAVVSMETPRMTTAIVNARDVAGAKVYYRERLGLHATTDSPWWTQYDTGTLSLALHPRVERPMAEQHHSQPVSFGFAVKDLMSWVDDARMRGVQFLSAPSDEGFGLMADAIDPDGNVITIREPAPAASLEEELAEGYEDDKAPHQVAIRKPVKKGARAVSRVVVKPEYTTSRKSSTRKKTASGAPAKKRAKSKTKHVPLAMGRLKKAEINTLKQKKRAVAKASRSKPVKRAAGRGGKR
jgi:catechol 2,3-dioxygenase-like lactoylglutathione lyase family enzyme